MKIIFSLSKLKLGLPQFTLILFLICQWASLSVASPDRPSETGQRLVPASLLNWPEEGSDYAILVYKSAQRVFVYHWNNLCTPVKVYKCSTGENGGPKSRRNDKKTPEGIYFFTHSYVKKELSSIYGAGAFPLDYPNPMDKKKGRDGYGIWFHGTSKLLRPNDTNGCIVLEDHSIDELAAYIKLNDTPVIISSKIEMVDQDKLEEEKRELLEIIEAWKRAWERKRIDRYMSLYSPRFTSDGKNWEKWKRHKARLANKYRQINVKIENLRLLKNDGVVLAKFDQRYSAEGFESQGEKRLYLQQNSSEWKIIGEFFQKEKIRWAPPKEPYLSSIEEIRRFISSWKKAWEEKDLGTYTLSYDAEFRSRGMDLGAWKKHRERLNRKYRSLKIEIMDLKIVQVSNRKARVSFKQYYQADEYEDYGLKNLFLVRKGQHWKIKKEEWCPVKGRHRQ